MRKIISILLLILINFSLTGCIINKENPYPYNGSYKELYTTAIYSIPNAVGYMHHGEGAYNSDIYIYGNRMIMEEHYFHIVKTMVIKFLP